MGTVDNPFTYPFSTAKATQFSGGSVKIVDSRTFKASTTIAAAEVTIEPGAIRLVFFQAYFGCFAKDDIRLTESST